jgi:hypothetical protein
MAIVGMTALSDLAVRLAIDLYDKGGSDALKPTPLGRHQELAER